MPTPLFGPAFGVAMMLAGCSHQPANTYQGYIEGKFVYVASPQSGRLDHLAVARGETVAVKQPLFAFDREPEASAVHNAQRLLLSSQSRLADLDTGKRPPEIEVTRAQLTQALAQKKQADQILESDKKQYQAGGIAQTDLIIAEEAADANAARVRELEADLAVDALPAREQQIKAQQNQVAADRASLSEAEWRLGQKDIDSPRQGLVFDTLYREGEWVGAGNPVVQILPPENMEIRFFVPETMVGKLKVGEKRAGRMRRLFRCCARSDHVHLAAMRIHAAGDLQQREPFETGVYDYRQTVRREGVRCCIPASLWR